MIQLIIFCVVSVFFILLSKKCLFAPSSHGFYRFFGFEFTLALILVNARNWFSNPFSIHQLVSWLLFVISIFFLINGIYLLKAVGRPQKEREDEHLIGIERTTQLVKIGAYKYIRHPIYASAFYAVFGVFLKNPSWISLVLLFAASISWVVTAKVEEKECVRFYGADYQAYMNQTKMFIPFLF